MRDFKNYLRDNQLVESAGRYEIKWSGASSGSRGAEDELEAADIVRAISRELGNNVKISVFDRMLGQDIYSK